MTKEEYRWHYAGLAMTALMNLHDSYEDISENCAERAVVYANTLIAELEKTAPKLECEHKFATHKYLANPPGGYTQAVKVCDSCGMEFGE